MATEPPPGDRTAQLAAWRKFVQGTGQRMTAPREVIFRAALDCVSPFTAEELLEASRREDPLISLATIYRTLPLLEEGGIIAAVDLGGDRQQYVAGQNAAQKLFLVCADCEKSIPIKDDCLWVREQFLAKQMGFQPHEISLRIRASCTEREADGTCQKHEDPA